MKTENIIQAFSVALMLVSVYFPQSSMADEVMSVQSKNVIGIDVPVKVENADIVFNMHHLAFRGDMPVGIKYMQHLANYYKEHNIKGKIIGLFYGEVAYLTLNDSAYNAYRAVSTGNPYKELIAGLLHQGVEIEECAVSMKGHNWSNDDLLPGVKVTTGAVIRLIQLAQQGYVQIQP